MTLTVKHFNYDILLTDHLSTFFFALLPLLLISFYIIKDQFARIGVFLMVIGLGIYVKRIDWIALPYIMILASLIYYGQHATKNWLRGWAFLFGIILSIYSILYTIPGLLHWPLVKSFTFSHKAQPYSMVFAIQSYLVGLFYLWFSQHTLLDSKGWKSIVKDIWLPSIFCMLSLMGPAIYYQYVQIDFKPTNFYFLWAVHNLFFVCIAEEVIFRGMIQQYLMLHLQTIQGGRWLAIILAAFAFGLLHYKGGWIYIGLASLAGLFYGYAFMKTKKIEASILVHFIVNSVHFLCFSYPALRIS